MNTYAANDDATVSDTQSLATWNRPRSLEELRSFVEGKHAALPDNLEIE